MLNDQVAQLAYEAYHTQLDLMHLGHWCIGWEALPAAVQTAWASATQAVIAHLNHEEDADGRTTF